MSPRNLLCLIFAIACTCHVGCCGCLSGMRCGSCCDPCCGVPEASCACPSCGCADGCCDCVSCGVADPGCCCPEPSCCCPDPCCGCEASCGVPCGCGTPVCGSGCGSCYPNQRLCDCPLLRRLRTFFCGCQSCATCPTPSYYGDWQSEPSSNCATCNQYGSYSGAQSGPVLAKRPPLKRGRNVSDEIRFADTQETTYR
ncbi:hypothetical protein Pla144_31910 [Bythopirellula polymerisocia]|uniref:Stigma-specific protein, Stig1 n=1 Tax=Bythopirellula polymerisocia TaxID=2528003 RepID=A0A5C6CR12_9BACT|nr:hypothetical protein Pla144_31910 [Bythopirellula polymerisocia]